MKAVYFSLMLCGVSITGASHAIGWLDIQRQYPQQQLQQLQADRLSLDVILLPAQTTQTRGTMVLLPTNGRHTYGPDIFRTLHQLTYQGWQLLLLPPPGSSDTSMDRQASLQAELQARWQLLRPIVQRPVIAIAQGEVAGTLHLSINSTEQLMLDALVSIGAYVSDPALDHQLQQQIPRQNLPVLDLITRVDHHWSTNTATERLRVARTVKNPFYRQRALDEFSYHGTQQEWLAREINGWLNTNGF